ncbi:hypothetical protein NPIL_632341 [Nephila pilipes]|uniref:Uncharacterized protein n=1 Tax=Nephila pilipes TaxID=299642 RepID=A0A8X6PRB7_NEPPI|nr:hypothetical protein NPIL_632341 [Nephila pilipes]
MEVTGIAEYSNPGLGSEEEIREKKAFSIRTRTSLNITYSEAETSGCGQKYQWSVILRYTFLKEVLWLLRDLTVGDYPEAIRPDFLFIDDNVRPLRTCIIEGIFRMM